MKLNRFISTLLLIMLCATLLFPTGMIASAATIETKYEIDTTDVATLSQTLADIATVSENGGVITITLTSDMFGQLYFNVNGSFILNANGKTLSSDEMDTPVFLENEVGVTVRIVGNGTFRPTEEAPWGWAVFNGLTNTLIIEDGTFYRGTEGTIFNTDPENLSNTTIFALADGYDYFNILKDDNNLIIKDRYFADMEYHHNIDNTLTVVQRNFNASFNTFADAGYYAEAPDSAEKEGAIAFNTFFTEYDEYPEVIEYFGLYVYRTGNEANKATAQSADKYILEANEGKFNILVEEIAEEYFGETVVAVPFIVIGGNVKMGEACTYSVSEGGKWLGPVGGAVND